MKIDGKRERERKREKSAIEAGGVGEKEQEE